MSHREKADRAAVEKLHALGTETSKKHPVEFFLYFSTEWDACVAATQLMNLRFKVSVNYSEGADEWLCLATKKLNPTEDRLMDVSSFMYDVAESHNGNYDGWGTPIIDSRQ